MKKIIAIFILTLSILIVGCSQVDKDTQKFADKYNKQYVNMTIAMLDMREANNRMKISNGTAKTVAANEAMNISKDFLKKYADIKELEKDPKFAKAKEAGIIKNDYKGKSKQELVKIYMDMK